MPRNKRDRYRFFPGEHARHDGVTHEVHSCWLDPTEKRRSFITRCGMIIYCKGRKRTTEKLTCIVCVDGGIFSRTATG